MEISKPTFEILKQEFVIHKLLPNENIPEKILNSEFYWIGKTDEELSIVCDSTIEIRSEICEREWSALRLIGILDFSQIGIISEISTVLAAEGISIFAISTFNTDYILIKKSNLNKAVRELEANGYTFEK